LAVTATARAVHVEVVSVPLVNRTPVALDGGGSPVTDSTLEPGGSENKKARILSDTGYV
jgi:hypothetical protein